MILALSKKLWELVSLKMKVYNRDIIGRVQKAYQDEWETSKSQIYYPYNLTSEYDVQALNRFTNENYDKDYEKTKAKTRFLVHETPAYSTMKDLDDKMAEVRVAAFETCEKFAVF